MAFLAKLMTCRDLKETREMATKEEWFNIIDQEEGQKLAISVIEEVLEKSQTVIFQRRIQNQFIPYTLNFVKDTILAVVDWRFLKRDNGQLDASTWEADIEPESVAPDAWARGILQVKKGVIAPKVTKAKEIAVPTNLKSVAREGSNVSLTDGYKRAQIYSEKKDETRASTRGSAAPTVSRNTPNSRATKTSKITTGKKMPLDAIIKEENRKMLDTIQSLEKGGEIVKAKTPTPKSKSGESTPKSTKRSLAPTPVKRPSSKLVEKIEELEKDEDISKTTNTENESQRTIQPRPPSTPPTHTTDPVLAKIFEKARPTVNRQSSSGASDQQTNLSTHKNRNFNAGS